MAGFPGPAFVDFVIAHVPLSAHCVRRIKCSLCKYRHITVIASISSYELFPKAQFTSYEGLEPAQQAG
jgi:hypothetical protein